MLALLLLDALLLLFPQGHMRFGYVAGPFMHEASILMLTMGLDMRRRFWTGDYTITVANLTNVHTVEAHQAPRASNGELVYYFYGPNDNPTAVVCAGFHALTNHSTDRQQLQY